ncbi:hypothetical protein KKC08_03885 [Patescibacteria group bacterium]|nr:hypothetical protein [Patescibacteria group bacterium]MCG2702497.1 hypothetical protein [Candidatus Parcubacteria bacterium]MBU4210818.1 hypothetical protein [Patescibacteria group bacterium]MBU4264550.1 hypothetical protein [Patescibacteria group bacterium]MBU4390218.1 hypothetical protein [Patescibacteria group bacterium]
MSKFILSTPIFAQVSIGSDTPLGTGSLVSRYPNLSSLLSILIKNSITIVSILLVVLLISGGLIYIISAGNQDPKNAEKGLKTIQSAAIGFIVVFLSYAIVQLIQTITGLNILNPTL